MKRSETLEHSMPLNETSTASGYVVILSVSKVEAIWYALPDTHAHHVPVALLTRFLSSCSNLFKPSSWFFL